MLVPSDYFHPPLTTEVIHVWQVSLRQPITLINTCWQVLNDEEQNRANRLVHVEHRDNFIVAHATLRYLIARYIACQPHEVVLQQTHHGKLKLAPESIPLRFNLSHAHDLAMYAFTLNREVGIDVEYMRADTDIIDIAQRFFTAEESTALLALPPTAQLQAFFNCWTRKEAFIKAIGHGLSYGLDQFTVDLTEANNITKLHLTINNNYDNVRSESSTSLSNATLLPTDDWSLFNLIAAPQYRAALVVAGKIETKQIAQYTIHTLDLGCSISCNISTVKSKRHT